MDKTTNLPGRGFTLSPDEALVQKDMASDCIYTESVGDFVLPDYLPEIRRVLRVSSRILPAGKYIGGAKAEFAGTVVHSVIYTGEGGGLAAANLSSDYEFSVPLGEEAQNCDPVVFAKSEIDSVVCRLSGPRKLSIRTKIKSCPHVLCQHSLEERIEGREVAEDEFSIERLTRYEKTMQTLYGAAQDLPLGDTIKLDGRDAAKVQPVQCEGVVHIVEAKAVAGGVNARGEVWIKCLCNEQGEERIQPFLMTKRIPFDQFIAIEGVTKDYESRVMGRCAAIDIVCDPDGAGGMTCDVTVDLEAEAVKNDTIRLTEDLYSTQYQCDCEYREVTLTSLARCAEGNFTVSGSMPRTEGDLARAAAVLDVGGSAQVENMDVTQGRCVITGNCKVNALLLCTPENAEENEAYELSGAEFIFPFKVEFENVEVGGPYEWDCPVEIISGRGRLDGNQLSVDIEIALCPKITEKKRIRAIAKARLNKESPVEKERAALRIYYPEQRETLWEVAKRYHASRKVLAELNELDAISLNDSNCCHSLDGFAYLIV